jgi:hypothetical protein
MAGREVALGRDEFLCIAVKLDRVEWQTQRVRLNLR